METALRQIPADKKLISVDGVGHDLKSGRFDLSAPVGELPKLLDK